MKSEEKAATHLILSQVKDEPWECACAACIKARQDGFEVKMSKRVELLILVRLLKQKGGLSTRIKKGKISEEGMAKLIPLKRDLLRKLFESEKARIENNEKEVLPPGGGSPVYYHPSTGGGVRVIRSTRGLGG